MSGEGIITIWLQKQKYNMCAQNVDLNLPNGTANVPAVMLGIQWKKRFAIQLMLPNGFILLLAAAMIAKPVGLHEIDSTEEQRYHTGLSELDRVLGGGLVKGSLVLISGDPGIGKSTILLQICQYMGNTLKILYVSGEESVKQIKLRASRLGVTSATIPCRSWLKRISRPF